MIKPSHQFFVLILLSLPKFLAATAVVPVPKVPNSFNFDGIVSVEEWGNIVPIELTMHTPVFKGQMTERTEIKMAYDENYIYLSGAMYDKEPDKIQAATKERDGVTSSTEWFGLLIDSYNDNQNALGFFTTPTGSRFDVAVSNDANGREPLNTSWNNFWDVKVNVNDQGWFAEMRIPFSSLQYQVNDNGQVVMGITTWRYIARKNELQIAPAISADQGNMAQWRPSLSTDFVFEGIRQKKPFYITPYVLGGYSKTNELNSANTAYEGKSELVRNVGLDAKIGLTNNFTLDLSVNTDFAQVEADDQQINLSRFSLFLPEKRLFFQERAGIFSYSLGSRNNLFYSRRIGIDDDGNAIPIIGGARITGRKGDWDLGLISIQTKETETLASNNYSIFRVKKRVLNENSDVGFLFTNNIDTDGNYNAVYGFDSSLRIYGDDLLSIKFAQAYHSGATNKALSLDPTMFWVSLSKRSQKGFVYATSFSRLGKDFYSNIGFLNLENYFRHGVRLGYNFFSGKNSKLFQHGPTIRGASIWENDDNTYNQAFYKVGYEWNWKNGAKLETNMRIQYDDLLEELDLADIVLIPADGYFYLNSEIKFESPRSLPYQLMGEINSGQFFDGVKHTLRLSPTYNISSSLRMDLTYEYNRVNFESRSQEFNTHIARLKALYMFSTKLSVSSFIQYNSLDQLFLGNIRLRLNPKEGHDLYVVYNTDVNESRSLSDPRLPVTNEGAVLVKWSYTFVL